MIVSKRLGYIVFCYAVLVSALLIYRNVAEYILPFCCSLGVFFLLVAPFSLKYKKISYLFMWIYALIVGLQMASLWHSNQLIQDLMISNIRAVAAVGEYVFYSSAAIVAVFLFISVWGIGGKTFNLSLRRYFFCVTLIGGLFVFVSFDKLPVYSFVKAFTMSLTQSNFKSDKKIRAQQKRIYGKNWVYQNNKENIPDLRGKNIVTIFSEGFSAKILDKNNQYVNLTFNISQLMNKSVWFDNYFNHTASTYRGIRGQLSSSYQYAGVGDYPNISVDEMKSIIEDTVINIPAILRDNGYHSYFLCAHAPSEHMISYLNTFGFDRVFHAADFIDDDRALSDRELFYYLGELLKSGQLQEPYFIGVYNIGTHVGRSSPDAVYLFNGEEINEVVNRFHNLDIMFGRFLRTVDENATLQQKTAIIFTTDHATFPTRDYQKAFGDYRTYFMSTIPLVLYYDGIKPQRIDAEARNSLDFAPTLLNWLRINNAYNYFLGCSLYDDECRWPFEFIYSMGQHSRYTTNGILLHKSKLHDKDLLARIYDFYHLSESDVGKWINYSDKKD